MHLKILSAPRETIKDWENGQELVRFLNQLDIFESCGKKAEIESLESLLNGHLRGNYLTKFYLPLSMDTYIESKASFKIRIGAESEVYLWLVDFQKVTIWLAIRV